MAQRSRPTLMKREREKARMEKQKMKEARRADRPARPSDRGEGGIDPDIAHIQLGPQPLADWQIELQQQEEKDREKSEEGAEKSQS
jgi:hypothetical protein